MCRTSITVLVVWILSASLPLSAQDHSRVPADRPLSRPEAIQEVRSQADELLRLIVEHLPEVSSLNGVPGARHDRLSDNSLVAEAELQRAEDKVLARLERISPDTLIGTPEWVTYGLMRERLEADRDLRTCRASLWNVNHTRSWIDPLATLAGVQHVGTTQERANSLVRFSQLPRFIDTEIAKLEEGIRLGYVAHAAVVQRVLVQVDALLAGPLESSPFFSPVQRDSTPEFREEFSRLVGDEIQPAFQRYRDYLKQEYFPRAREQTDLSALPDGAECYQAAIRRYTTLRLTPQEIHDLGKRDMERAKIEASEFATMHFGNADARAVLDDAAQQSAYRIGTRDQVLRYSEQMVERSKQEAPRWFNRLPRADLVVEPVPSYAETGAAPGYYLAAPSDGSRPAVFRVNLRRYTEESGRVFDLDGLAFHEGIPGHHLEIGLTVERSGAHPVERFLRPNAFSEGWGEYAEALAREMGLYASEHAWLNRLVRGIWGNAILATETGALALGWTRQEAIEFLVQEAGDPFERAAFRTDRSLAWPGQLLSYQLGYIEIVRLREEAKRRLGSRFDIREFHDRVLENGSITLPMLREHVERWIEQEEPTR
jgi:uncharacterized protein (DUF885 family)